MFKEYRLEIVVVAGVLGGIMLYQGNMFWIAAAICVVSNYICYKQGI